MKYIIALSLISACSMFEKNPEVPKIREEATQCPSEACGEYKTGVVCSGGSHHSDASKCPYVK